MTKGMALAGAARSCFDIRHCFVIRASTFGIGTREQRIT